MTSDSIHDQLQQRLGSQNDKAIAAWQEFLRRTEAGDAIIEPQRAEARAALQRLRDPSSSR